MRLVTAKDSFEQENIKVRVEKFKQAMTQINRSIFPELQAAIKNNDLMVVGEFLIIPNLRDCPQESLEVFGQAYKAHLLSPENCEHKELENKV